MKQFYFDIFRLKVWYAEPPIYLTLSIDIQPSPVEQPGVSDSFYLRLRPNGLGSPSFVSRRCAAVSFKPVNIFGLLNCLSEHLPLVKS